MKNQEQLLKDIEEIKEKVDKIYRYILFQRIYEILKLLFFIGMAILGLIYLPPMINGIFESYRELIGI